METKKRNLPSLLPVEEKLADIFWNALLGGFCEKKFREVRNHGVQCLKMTGTAFVCHDGTVIKITGLRGAVHPCRTGGQKKFCVDGVRTRDGWKNPADVLKKRKIKVKDKLFGTYQIVYENDRANTS